MEKHRDMEGQGKGDGHQHVHGRKPRTPESFPLSWKLIQLGSYGKLDTYGR